MNKVKTWSDLDWNPIESRVSRIQRRIYRASSEGNVAKVHYLQGKLTNSLDAKVLSVRQVTSLNRGKRTPGVDQKTYESPLSKWKLANNLKLDGKSSMIRRVYIDKPGKKEKRPLGIPTIKDRAKQNLIKLALEPEWEAKFEPGSYGFRPGRSAHDAIENVFTSVRGKEKFVFEADVTKFFDQVNHKSLLDKLKTTKKIRQQIEAWLKADIMVGFAQRPKELTPNPGKGTPQGGDISPLLANIALHGLGEDLKSWYANSHYPNKKQGKVQRAKEIGFIRYADDFVVICPSPEVAAEVKNLTSLWLQKIGLKLNLEKTLINPTTKGFNFLGFQIVAIGKNEKIKAKIHISRSSKVSLLNKVRFTLKKNKSASSYTLIKKLAPILTGWANYFMYSECSSDFQQMDNRIYGQLRAWVFRRKAQGMNRTTIKEKYFPSGNTYTYKGIKHQDNWVLCGSAKTSSGKIDNIYLNKLAWTPSRKFVKVKGNYSVFNGEHVYWTQRLINYTFYPGRLRILLRKQKGLCPYCKRKFNALDTIEVDHIKPKSEGGQDIYLNLQALHKQCHINKTNADRQRSLDKPEPTYPK